MEKVKNPVRGDNMTASLAMIHLNFARTLMDAYGFEGEATARKVMNHYATVRARDLRKAHMDLGMKTNLKNMFYFCDNPYTGSSTIVEINKVTEQEDRRETPVCPFAEVFRVKDEMDIGAMYCEETHFLLWQEYAPTAIVNIGNLLTHKGDTKCTFDIFLRPGRMTEQQRKECFEEYDPDFKGDRRDEFVFPTTKQANAKYNTIMLDSYYTKTIELMGEKMIPILEKAAEKYLNEYIAWLKNAAVKQGETFNWEFWQDNSPYEEDMSKDYWDRFSTDEAKEFYRKHIYDAARTKIAR